MSDTSTTTPVPAEPEESAVTKIRQALFINTPGEAVGNFLLSPREVVIEKTKPAFDAYVLGQLPSLLIVAFAVIVLIIAHTLVALIVAIVVIAYLSVRLVQGAIYVLYTQFVVTSFRFMRVEGFFRRRCAWMPWTRVTDVVFEQSWWERLFRFGDITIESANEKLSLRRLENLDDPVRFHQLLTAMVHLRQDPTAFEEVLEAPRPRRRQPRFWPE